MNETNVFFISEKNGNSAGNNSNGHWTSIHAGGKGHYEGDGCTASPVGVDSWVHFFVVIAIAIILTKK